MSVLPKFHCMFFALQTHSCQLLLYFFFNPHGWPHWKTGLLSSWKGSAKLFPLNPAWRLVPSCLHHFEHKENIHRLEHVSAGRAALIPWAGLQRRGSRWSLWGWAAGLHDGSRCPSSAAAAHVPPEEPRGKEDMLVSRGVSLNSSERGDPRQQSGKDFVRPVVEKCVAQLASALPASQLATRWQRWPQRCSFPHSNDSNMLQGRCWHNVCMKTRSTNCSKMSSMSWTSVAAPSSKACARQTHKVVRVSRGSESGLRPQERKK